MYTLLRPTFNTNNIVATDWTNQLKCYHPADTNLVTLELLQFTVRPKITFKY